MMDRVAPPLTEGELLVRNHFTFEKRRKELDKRKKKEAKRQAKADRKAAIEAGETVGWSIYDENGTLLHEEWDIAPPPGKRREFVFQGASELSVRCEVLAGNDNVKILIDRDR